MPITIPVRRTSFYVLGAFAIISTLVAGYFWLQAAAPDPEKSKREQSEEAKESFINGIICFSVGMLVLCIGTAVTNRICPAEEYLTFFEPRRANVSVHVGPLPAGWDNREAAVALPIVDAEEDQDAAEVATAPTDLTPPQRSPETSPPAGQDVAQRRTYTFSRHSEI